MTEQELKETLSKFGAAVKSFRQRLGISQEELAERSGLHRTYVTDVERGARNVTMESITKLARALNVPLAELFAKVEGSELAYGLATEHRTNTRLTSPVNILLVEDNPKHAELTLFALEKYGVANNVLVVHSGEEALEFLQGRRKTIGRAFPPKPKLILLDLSLPNIDGMEVLRNIRADANTRDIPVIILTASRSDQDIKESNMLGVTAYINKPVEFFEFSTIIPKLGLHWLVVQ
jgi:CheY-like chemotaxis protein/DNA-binding XRE family transcriptional regulator